MNKAKNKKQIVFVAVAEIGASPLFHSEKAACEWIKETNPQWGTLLYRVEEWELTQSELEMLLEDQEGALK